MIPLIKKGIDTLGEMFGEKVVSEESFDITK